MILYSSTIYMLITETCNERVPSDFLYCQEKYQVTWKVSWQCPNTRCSHANSTPLDFDHLVSYWTSIIVTYYQVGEDLWRICRNTRICPLEVMELTAVVPTL